MGYTITVGQDYEPLAVEPIRLDEVTTGDYVTARNGISAWQVSTRDNYIGWVKLHTILVASEQVERVGQSRTLTVNTLGIDNQNGGGLLRFWRAVSS